MDFPCSARLGSGNAFVIEADEYDTAFFDKRSKFLHYRPLTLILNNLEFDHADIFADLSAIQTQFHHLVRTVPGRGRLIVNALEPALGSVLDRGCWSSCESFQSPDGWHLQGAPGSGAQVFRGAEHLGELRLALAGEHNRANALAAVAASAHVGVPVAQALDALASFKGVRRRLEQRGTADSVTVHDDFAHHPSAFDATIAALRERIGTNARLIAVFEPRSNTMRMGAMRSRLAASLARADAVYCHRQGLSWDPAAELTTLGDRAQCLTDPQALLDRLLIDLRPGDQVLMMSNGGFGGLHERLLKALAERARTRTGASS
jgi:UDP-N-acetylmuramate: L-alanyl-gamma-D-glutamyl-meso-diaminopimelate ligase